MPKKTRFTRTLTTLNIAFLALGEMSFTSSLATTNAERVEQQIALLQKTRPQELEFLTGLEKATKEEQRNEAWASQKESELQRSFSAEEDVQNAVLKSVECHSSKCDLQFQVSLEGRDTAEQWVAINHWIATAQPCGYTMTHWPNPEQPSGEIRVFLNCGEQ